MEISNRFDYVKYDEEATQKQGCAKMLVQALEFFIDKSLTESSRAKAIAIAKLEEVYMWIGKAIRDEQVHLRGAELQEGRKNEGDANAV